MGISVFWLRGREGERALDTPSVLKPTHMEIGTSLPLIFQW